MRDLAAAFFLRPAVRLSDNAWRMGVEVRNIGVLVCDIGRAVLLRVCGYGYVVRAYMTFCPALAWIFVLIAACKVSWRLLL